MIHWTTKDTIKERPLATLIIFTIMITAIAGGIGFTDFISQEAITMSNILIGSFFIMQIIGGFLAMVFGFTCAIFADKFDHMQFVGLGFMLIGLAMIIAFTSLFKRLVNGLL